jgi:hypothetical protein
MGMKLLNFALYQVVWFAAVWGAARGTPWLGVGVLMMALAVHLAVTPGKGRSVRMVLISAATGYVLDSALVLGHVLSFPERARLGAPTALWMVALWVGFGITLDGCLAWLNGRYGLGAVLGLLGGPLAYGAGVRMGALGVAGTSGYAAVAVEWGVAMPALLWFNRPDRAAAGRAS